MLAVAFFALSLAAVLAPNSAGVVPTEDAVLRRVRRQRPIVKHIPLGSTDPELWMNVSQIIRHWGYPAELHEVTTEDGYILFMQRIPHGKDGPGTGKRPVVYLQHGLEGCSSNWVVNLPHQSAAFIYADAGYDVWLGNFRGNTYGKRHINYTTDQMEFWRFTWDESAEYDLPVQINKILETTGQDSLYLVAHSEGTMAAFAKLPQDAELAKKVKIFFALSPITTLGHLTGFLRYVSWFLPELDLFLSWVGYKEFLPSNAATKIFAKYVCGFHFSNPLCSNVLFLIAGPDGHQLNQTRVPIFVAHSPAGTSSQNIIHFGQMVNSGKFQKYNFGSKDENQLAYKQDEPPLYTLDGFETPTYLFSGTSDILSNPTDVQNLVPKLSNLRKHYTLKDFNHMDFIWGLRAAEEIYNPILKVMQENDAKERDS